MLSGMSSFEIHESLNNLNALNILLLFSFTFCFFFRFFAVLHFGHYIASILHCIGTLTMQTLSLRLFNSYLLCSHEFRCKQKIKQQQQNNTNKKPSFCSVESIWNGQWTHPFWIVYFYGCIVRVYMYFSISSSPSSII